MCVRVGSTAVIASCILLSAPLLQPASVVDTHMLPSYRLVCPLVQMMG